MIHALLEGISQAIYAAFGDAYPIYTEEVEQGLEPPCFYLTCVDALQNRVRGTLFQADYRMMVLYFPESEENPRQECQAVADRLWFALEVVRGKLGFLRGSNLQADIRDGLLNFSITYRCRFTAREETETMQTLQASYKGR